MYEQICAPVVICPGKAAVGKGFTTQLIAQIARENQFEPVIVGTGVAFREVAWMLNALGNESRPETALHVITRGQWSYARGKGFALEMDGNRIEEGSDELMTDYVSGIISRFSTNQVVRDSLFNFNTGAIGRVVNGIMTTPVEEGCNPALIIYDTRFAPGEFPIQVLERLASESMLAVLHLEPESDEAMRELARLRAANVSRINPSDVTDELINETLQKLQLRNEADVLFDPSFVLSNITLASTYYKILNHPSKGVEPLREQLIRPIISLARQRQ